MASLGDIVGWIVGVSVRELAGLAELGCMLGECVGFLVGVADVSNCKPFRVGANVVGVIDGLLVGFTVVGERLIEGTFVGSTTSLQYTQNTKEIQKNIVQLDKKPKVLEKI